MSTAPPTDKLTRYVTLEKERRDLEARLEQVGEETKTLQELLLEEWADRGQKNATVAGLTVFIKNDFYCSKKGGIDTRVVCEALNANGLSMLVAPGYNAQSLKAWIHERVREAEEAGLDPDTEEPAQPNIPAKLAELLRWDTVPRLSTRKAS